MFVVPVSVVVGMRVLCRPDVLHLHDVSALGAALDWAFAGQHHPQLVVRVCGDAVATDVLLVAKGLYEDGVFQRP